MGITIIPSVIEGTLLTTADAGSTIGVVRRKGRYYRHPDSATISYPLVVDQPSGLGTIPSDKKLSIAIIGGGVAGIASYYELSMIEKSNELIKVTLYESDLEHFAPAPETNPLSIKTFGKKAGRIFAATSQDDETDHSVYEIGAMRFPEIAGLTWHYARVAFEDEAKIKLFPNPGQIPTEFVCGNRVDRYNDGKWLDPKSPTKLLAVIVRDGLYGNKDSGERNISYFRIGGIDPMKITKELGNEKTPLCRLEQIQTQWKLFAKEYDGMTLESAVRKIIRYDVSRLPEVDGLNDDEEKINYYAEIFGCFGFGTGGFKSIFNISLVEMMRLFLWDYAKEYTLPVEENVQFIKRLYELAQKKNSNIEVRRARVCDVCHSGDDDKAMVFSYGLDKDGKEDLKPKLDKFDYVILAVAPKQMNSVISRAGFSNNQPREMQMGDYGRPYEQILPVRPPLVLHDKFDAPNSQIFSAINQIHMVTSSKIFATISEDTLKYAPEFGEHGKINAIVSDCGLASSYIVPSPFSKPRIDNGEKKETLYYSFLISYNWEEDTKRLHHQLYEYPMNKTHGSDNNKLMMNAAINRTVRHVIDPEDGKYKNWWFGEMLSKGELSDTLSYDWTTEHSSGAFKLDTTGGYYNSHLCFRYHTHALDPKLKNKFFIAGDSYSHLGGWMEGAFMSAVNAVTGLIVAANGGKTDTLSSDEGRKVMEAFERVANSNESCSK